jgi:methionine sulfoxide reductase heme-binding subunit
MTAGHQLFWITSRAAGTAALISASVAVTVGLLVSRPGADKLPLRAAHETLSLVTLGLVAVHGASLLGDSYLNPGLRGIALPFALPYRPLWTGLGIIAAYGLGALGLSYYVRSRIGAVRWRQLHRFTALFWVLGIAHSIGAGTDAGQIWFRVAIGCAVVPAAVLLAGTLVRRARPALEAPRGSPPPARQST